MYYLSLHPHWRGSPNLPAGLSICCCYWRTLSLSISVKHLFSALPLHNVFFYCFLPSLLSSSVGHGRWRRMSLLKECPSMDSTCSRPFCFNKINMTIITTALRQITVCMCGCFLSLCLNGIKGDVLRIRGVDVGGLISFSSLFSFFAQLILYATHFTWITNGLKVYVLDHVWELWW